MTNFKGTKDKWEYLHIEKENGDCFKVMCNETSICNITTRNKTQAESNAKLISCAPEMLEMLEKTLDRLKLYCGNISNDGSDNGKLLYNVEQLIKKATE